MSTTEAGVDGRAVDHDAVSWLLTWLIGLVGGLIVGASLGAEWAGWQMQGDDRLVVAFGAACVAGSTAFLLRWRKRIARPHNEWEAIAQIRAVSAAWGHSLDGRGDDEVRNAVLTFYEHLGPGGYL